MTIENIFEDLLMIPPLTTQILSVTNVSANEVAQTTLLHASQNRGPSATASFTAIQASVQNANRNEIFINLPNSILEIILTYQPNTIKNIISHFKANRMISLHEKNILNALLKEKDSINKKIKELNLKCNEIFSRIDNLICHAFSKQGGCKKSEEEIVALENQVKLLEEEIVFLEDIKISFNELERLKLSH